MYFKHVHQSQFPNYAPNEQTAQTYIANLHLHRISNLLLTKDKLTINSKSFLCVGAEFAFMSPTVQNTNLFFKRCSIETALQICINIKTPGYKDPIFTGTLDIRFMLLTPHVKTTVYREHILCVPRAVFIYKFRCITNASVHAGFEQQRN